MKDETAGDPMSEQKWQRSSLRHLSDELRKTGHAVSHMTVGRLLVKRNYSLKVNLKRFCGTSHPDRTQQFEYLEAQKQAFLAAGWPVISVDTKKKELIGNFKNNGRSWCQQAIEVNDHDFDQDALGKAVPYGIYDVNHNLGFVYVGRSATERRSHFADTPQFAVDVIAEWWQIEGRVLFPNQHKILILADAGGSNGCRPRLWKQQLQEQLADRLGLEVLVCHYPTGTSKWNPVEHRLFGPISINWAGKPLLTFETVLAYLRGTVTETGLQVKAFLIDKEYVKGLKVPKPVFQTLNIQFAEVCPRWNYIIRPHLSCT